MRTLVILLFLVGAAHAEDALVQERTQRRGTMYKPIFEQAQRKAAAVRAARDAEIAARHETERAK